MTLTRRLAAVLAAAAVWAAAPAAARAADAKLARASGKVFIRPLGEKRESPAQAGDPLLLGDQLRTGEKSQAHVVFADGTTVLVKESGTFTMEGSARENVVRFSVGEFLIGLKRKLTKGSSFRVRTPSAVASVRGTLFWGLADADQNTTYAALADEISIEAQGKTLVLQPGQTVKIPKGGPPGAPSKSDIPPKFLKTFSVDGSLEGLQALLPKK